MRRVEIPPGEDTLRAEEVTFRGRRAIRLSNELVELSVLPGGGHVAEMRLRDSVNPLWEPHWKTMEPEQYDPSRHTEYGSTEGRLLSSFAGHALCLNHFGPPSASEIAAGGYAHGEAANLPWQVFYFGTLGGVARIDYGLDLPEAGMRFRRTISLDQGVSQVHFDEEITNLRRSDTPLAYQQHVTLGAPLVEPGVARLDLSGTAAHTYPRSFGSCDSLEPDREFTWPIGPGGQRLDVFPERGPLCSVCTVALDTNTDTAFAAVSNARLGLLIAYTFSSETFPWTALWFENGGSEDAPYGGKTMAWGVEFGTCALPLERMETLSSGPILAKRRFGVLPAASSMRVSYDAILQRIPPGWRGVERIERCSEGLVVFERGSVNIPDESASPLLPDGSSEGGASHELLGR